METDRREPPTLQFEGPFTTQQESEQPTRPVFPQVRFNYRCAANSDYEYLHSQFLTIFFLVPCFAPRMGQNGAQTPSFTKAIMKFNLHYFYHFCLIRCKLK